MALDFLNAASSAMSVLTFTRASAATYFDAAGAMQTAAVNAPRFDFDPVTLAARGLLFEEQRVNQVRNPRLEGSVTGVVGSGGAVPTNWFFEGTTPACTVVGAGSEGGIPYAEVRFVGNATFALDFEAAATAVAANGQAWAASAFLRLTAGSFTNITPTLEITPYTSGGTNLTRLSAGISTPSAAPLGTQRHTCVGTMTDATTAFANPRIRFGAAGSFDFTLRIGTPQLEQGTFATSPIMPPAGSPAAATRSADVATVALPNGSYDVLVQDRADAEWRNAVVVSGGSYTLTPRSGQTRIARLRVWPAGRLTTAQKTAMQVAA